MRKDLEEKVKKVFMSMNKSNMDTLIIIEPTHPLFKIISTLFETRTPDEALASFETYDIIYDLTILRTKNKISFLKELSKTTKAKIISDLTLCWGEMVLKNCPRVVGAISILFYSPTSSVEYFANSDETKYLILRFLSLLEKKGVNHAQLKLGFHYPRVISMIINEAYFAIEENLATPNDIDLAMKNGVNYPLGPVEWGNKIGLNLIIELLMEYTEITEDPRYRISRELKFIGLKS
jgi:3-hydroxybutyryl-CoA dehydrogenase